MTNQEIDKRLALAIGYTADRVRCLQSFNPGNDFVQVLNDDSRCDGPTRYEGWQRFDHTDPAVIWPIAERFKCFPQRMVDLRTKKEVWFSQCDRASIVGAADYNPATASALAVIKYCEGRK